MVNLERKVSVVTLELWPFVFSSWRCAWWGGICFGETGWFASVTPCLATWISSYLTLKNLLELSQVCAKRDPRGSWASLHFSVSFLLEQIPCQFLCSHEGDGIKGWKIRISHEMVEATPLPTGISFISQLGSSVLRTLCFEVSEWMSE